MAPLLIAFLGLVMVGTAFLSGIFGMAGGMILIGVLLALLPVPDAMALHAVTQMSSNGWRALLWLKHVRWRPIAFYLSGCVVMLALWSLWRPVPSKPLALLLLGMTPFLARLLPPGLKPDPERFAHGAGYGAICMSLLLLTGVTGPLLDAFFLGGRMERRQIVATKAVCQVFGHAAKLAYFGGIVASAAAIDPLVAGMAVLASMLGTSLARRILERMTDRQYRTWADRIITGIAGYYVLQGAWLLVRV